MWERTGDNDDDVAAKILSKELKQGSSLLAGKVYWDIRFTNVA